MQNRTGQNETRAAGMGHGKGGQARHSKAKQGRCNKQPADEVAGTGLAAKQPADEMAGTGLAVNTASRRSWPAPCLEMEVGGGSAVVLATRKAGSDLPYRLPPNLSPLPVSVHPHPLNLQKPI